MQVPEHLLPHIRKILTVYEYKTSCLIAEIILGDSRIRIHLITRNGHQ